MSSCILSWLKPRKDGYAVIRRNGRNHFHHRRVLEQKLGRPLKPRMYACHTPMEGGHPKNCIAPWHLYEGTPSDNARDRVTDGIDSNSLKTHCKHGHLFDDANTYIKPTGSRGCRACHRSEAQAARDRKKAPA